MLSLNNYKLNLAAAMAIFLSIPPSLAVSDFGIDDDLERERLALRDIVFDMPDGTAEHKSTPSPEITKAGLDAMAELHKYFDPLVYVKTKPRGGYRTDPTRKPLTKKHLQRLARAELRSRSSKTAALATKYAGGEGAGPSAAPGPARPKVAGRVVDVHAAQSKVLDGFGNPSSSKSYSDSGSSESSGYTTSSSS